MAVIFKNILLLIMLMIAVPSCKKPSQFSHFKSDEKLSESELLAKAAQEFDDLQIDLDLGYVGTVKKSNPSQAFLAKEEMEDMEKEMKQAFSGEGTYLKFLYCDYRSVFVRTTDRKECDYVVGGEDTTFEFAFIAYDMKKNESCMLIESGCMIYQQVKVLAKNDGIQRPPVFIFTRPASKTMMIFTNRIFHTTGPGLGNYLKRWTESDHFGAVVMTPYTFSRPFGEELAQLLGNCGGQYMNIIHFSHDALKRFRDFKKPVQLSAITANSLLLTGMAMLGGGSLLRLKGTLASFRMGGKFTLSKLTKRQLITYGLDFVDDVSAIPYVLADLGNWKDHVKQYPENSVQHRAIQTALFLSNFGDIAGLSHLGLVAQKHWKTTAKVLSVLAGVGVTSAVAVNTPAGKDLVSSLRHGNIQQVRASLCQVQKNSGLRTYCPPVEVHANTCK